MSNTDNFKWDNDNAIDFVNYCVRRKEEYLTMGELLNQFIASKEEQLPSNKEFGNDIVVVGIATGSCDVETWHFKSGENKFMDSFCRQLAESTGMNVVVIDGKVIGTYQCALSVEYREGTSGKFDSIKKQPPPVPENTTNPAPTEPSLSTDWQIIDMKDCRDGYIHPYHEKSCTQANPQCTIHSVKRLSDNEVFTVGSEVEYRAAGAENWDDICGRGKINWFKLQKNHRHYEELVIEIDDNHEWKQEFLPHKYISNIRHLQKSTPQQEPVPFDVTGIMEVIKKGLETYRESKQKIHKS